MYSTCTQSVHVLNMYIYRTGVFIINGAHLKQRRWRKVQSEIYEWGGGYFLFTEKNNNQLDTCLCIESKALHYTHVISMVRKVQGNLMCQMTSRTSYNVIEYFDFLYDAIVLCRIITVLVKSGFDH